jgi:hypothetical protein
VGGRLEKTIQDYASGQIRIVICNRKAELGVNLQNDTAAIHHLTLPWTPASVQQRNGRGVRQGNLTSEVAVHYYFGRNTFDRYRHLTLKVKANWMNELLSGQMPDMENGQAPNIEEILELLSDNPEAAALRKREREERAMLQGQEREAQGLWNLLRGLCQLWARLQKADTRNQHLIASREEEVAKCQKALAALSEKNDVIENKRLRLLAKQETVAGINKSLSEPDLKAKDKKVLKSKLIYAQRSLDNTRRSLEQALESQAAKKMAAQRRLEAAKERLKDGLEKEEAKKESAKRDSALVKRNETYLRDMAKEGKLPYDLSLLDRLGAFLVGPKGGLIEEGAFFVLRAKGNKSAQGLEVIRLKALDLSFEARIFDPILGIREETMEPGAMAGYERASLEEFYISNQWRYGQLRRTGLFSKATFPSLCRWLPINGRYGAVGQSKDGGYKVFWEGGLEDGYVLAFPEPEKEEFRQCVLNAYLADKDSGRANLYLMNDLFGEEDRELLAAKYIDGPESELSSLMGTLWDKARLLFLSGEPSNRAQILRKIQDLLRTQSILSQDPGKPAGAEVFREHPDGFSHLREGQEEGQFFILRSRGSKSAQGLEKIGPTGQGGKFRARIFDPILGLREETMGPGSLAGYERATLEEFYIANQWRYGQLRRTGLFSKDIFPSICRWLPVNGRYGAVGQSQDGSYKVFWEPDTYTLEEGYVLAFPEPEKEEFRQSVFGAYLADKTTGRVNHLLMSDLFGDDYDALATKCFDGPDTELLSLVGTLWDKAKLSLSFGGTANGEQILKKLQELLRIQSKISQDPRKQAEALGFKEIPDDARLLREGLKDRAAAELAG